MVWGHHIVGLGAQVSNKLWNKCFLRPCRNLYTFNEHIKFTVLCVVLDDFNRNLISEKLVVSLTKLPISKTLSTNAQLCMKNTKLKQNHLSAEINKLHKYTRILSFWWVYTYVRVYVFSFWDSNISDKSSYTILRSWKI